VCAPRARPGGPVLLDGGIFTDLTGKKLPPPHLGASKKNPVFDSSPHVFPPPRWLWAGLRPVKKPLSSRRNLIPAVRREKKTRVSPPPVGASNPPSGYITADRSPARLSPRGGGVFFFPPPPPPPHLSPLIYRSRSAVFSDRHPPKRRRSEIRQPRLPASAFPLLHRFWFSGRGRSAAVPPRTKKLPPAEIVQFFL